MAGGGEDKSSKTEQATPQKRKDSRKKGQVAKSQDLMIATGLLTAFAVMFGLAETFQNRFLTSMTTCFEALEEIGLTGDIDLRALGFRTVIDIAIISLPVLLGVMTMAIVVNLIQTQGLIVTGEQIKPKMEKINPMKGIKRWFAIKSLVELFKSLVKIAVTGYLAYRVWLGVEDQINGVILLTPEAILALGANIIKKLFIYVLILYIFISVLDVLFQKWQHSRDLKMSKKELKDEYKRTEGDPYQKQARKQIHQQIVMQQSTEHVPQSDVVVINPTQLAVALKYDPEISPVPYVLAKGDKRLADEIRESAKNAGIPVVRNKPLARSLFEVCEIGDIVPSDLYRPVAEVLAYVFALKDNDAAQAPVAGDPAGQPERVT